MPSMFKLAIQQGDAIDKKHQQLFSSGKRPGELGGGNCDPLLNLSTNRAWQH